jgi:hypothetical protein
MEVVVMIIGFTGTKKGMTDIQKDRVGGILQYHMPPEVRHGDCVGADKQFHEIVRRLCPGAKIVVHPPEFLMYRAFCKGDVILPAKPYLRRDDDIVGACEFLIATPKEGFEVLRSGTWATIRRARKKGKHVTIIYPDGTYGVFAEVGVCTG